MRIGVVGSRRRNTNQEKALLQKRIYDYLNEKKILPIYVLFVSGGCKQGADRFIKEMVQDDVFPGAALQEHLPDIFPGMAYWDMVNAYYARNKKIAEGCDVLFAQVAADRKGGTENTIKHAKAAGIEVILV